MQLIAGVLSIPKFASNRYRDLANFGIGTLALAVMLALGGCGVKGDLEKPTQQTQKGEKDASRPPSPIGR